MTPTPSPPGPITSPPSLSLSPTLLFPGYTLHTLAESEIPQWTEFCASCFSYKPNPPPASYFARHFFNDPLHDASLVRVIRHSNDGDDDDKNNNGVSDGNNNGRTEMVASTRVFTRLISCGSRSCAGAGSVSGSSSDSASGIIHAGGIGEVCTATPHRKKGLAKALLQSSIHAMMTHPKVKFQCSLLHASPALTEVYKRSSNYQSVMSYWSVVHVNFHSKVKNTSHNDSDNGVFNFSTSTRGKIRLASFPSDTSSLQRIHKAYSEDRFAGCIIRSEEYWNDYLSQEIGDSLYVITVIQREEKDTGAGDENTRDKDHETIVGWMSVRQRSSTRLQLRDFGICKQTCRRLGIQTSMVFPRLLQQAVRGTTVMKDSVGTQADAHADDDTDKGTVELHLPTVVLKEMQEEGLNQDTCHWIEWTKGIQEENDPGWMYKSLQGCNEEDTDEVALNMVKIVEEQNIPHLIWPADSF